MFKKVLIVLCLAAAVCAVYAQETNGARFYPSVQSTRSFKFDRSCTSSDGKLLVLSLGAELTVYRQDDMLVLARLVHHQRDVRWMSFIGSSYRLVSADGSGLMAVYDLEAGQKISERKLDDSGVDYVAFSRDYSRILRITKFQHICIEDFDGKNEYFYPAFNEDVVWAQISADGTGVDVLGSNGKLLSWKMGAKSEKPSKTRTIAKEISDVFPSADGRYVAVRTPDAMLLISTADGKTLRKIPKFADHVILYASFSPDGSFIAAADSEGNTAVFDVLSGKQICIREGGGIQTASLAYIHKGLLLSSHVEPKYGVPLQILDIPSFTSVWQPHDSIQYPVKTAFSPDGSVFAAAYYSGLIRLFRTEDMDPFWDIHAGSGPEFLFFIPGTDELIYDSMGNYVKRYDWKKKKNLGDLKSAQGGIFESVSAYSPKGSLFIGKMINQQAKMYSGADRREIGSPPQQYGANIFSGDESTLVFYYDYTVNVYDVPSKKLIREFSSLPGKVISAASDQVGSVVMAGCSDGSTVYLGVSSGEKWVIPPPTLSVLGRITASTTGARGVIFAPDDSWFISTGNGWEPFFFGLKNQKEPQFTGHEGSVAHLSVSADGRYFLSAGGDGVVRLHSVSTGKSLALRVFTGGDWIVMDDDGRFDGSLGAARHLVMVNGITPYSLEQFALQANRPDVLFSSFGTLSEEGRQYYSALYERRRRKAGLAGILSADELWNSKIIPSVSVLSSVNIGGSAVRLSVSGVQGRYRVKDLLVWVNGVSVQGYSLPKNLSSFTIDVPVVSGDKIIEVGLRDEAGCESLRVSAAVPPVKESEKRTLYYVGFGVSEYESIRPQLSFAHKDALDLAARFSSLKGASFSEVRTRTFINAHASVQSLAEARSFIADAQPSDALILFVAGHGMHDIDTARTYYWLPSAADLSDLPRTAVDYSAFDSLLLSAAARTKVFFMDTCESGEMGAGVSFLAGTGVGKGMSPAVARAVTVTAAQEGGAKKAVTGMQSSTVPRSSFLRTGRYINYDLDKRSGALVMSSCQADESSLEDGTVQNGYFTEAILQSLSSSSPADTNGDRMVDLDELRVWTRKKVAELSNGQQNPVVDRDNPFTKLSFPVK